MNYSFVLYESLKQITNESSGNSFLFLVLAHSYMSSELKWFLFIKQWQNHLKYTVSKEKKAYFVRQWTKRSRKHKNIKQVHIIHYVSRNESELNKKGKKSNKNDSKSA